MKLTDTAIAMIGAMLLSTSALAQDSTDGDTVITSVTSEDIRKIIESDGHTIVSKVDGDVAWTARDADGINFAVQGTACDDDQRCNGVQIIIAISDVGTLEYANQINRRYAAIKATAYDDRELMLSRYMILDSGQTVANIQDSISVALYAMKTIRDDHGEDSDNSSTPSISSIDWGDDSGRYANDGACDDARFIADGDDWTYQRQHVLRDASDCRAKFADGSITLLVDFGDNSGVFANDNTCDDNRFTGSGRSVLTSDSNVKRDSADCIAAYQAGTISRK